MFWYLPKFNFTVRQHIMVWGLEILTILATMRRPLSMRCTWFLYSSHTWSRSITVQLMIKARTIPVKEILRVGNLLHPRTK